MKKQPPPVDALAGKPRASGAQPRAYERILVAINRTPRPSHEQIAAEVGVCKKYVSQTITLARRRAARSSADT